MTDIGIKMIFVFLLSLCAGGLVAWTVTLRRWLRRLPAYPPETRLVSTWGFAELLLCLGVYILFTGLAGMALLRAGFHLSPDEAVADVAAVVSGDAEVESEAEVGEDAKSGDNAVSAAQLRQAREQTGALIAADGAARLITIAVVLTMLGVYDRLILRRFGLIPRARDIAIGLVASCMLLPLVFAMQAALTHWVPYEHAVLEILNDAPPAWVLISMAFTSMIVAPIAEEFFFRGLLQGWFQRVASSRAIPAAQTSPTGGGQQDSSAVESSAVDTPDRSSGEQGAPEEAASDEAAQLVSGELVQDWPWWPVIASSLIFAIAHLGQGAAPIVLFFLAIGLGYLYRVTGRLWPSITVHFVLNSISTLMTIFAT